MNRSRIAKMLVNLMAAFAIVTAATANPHQPAQSSEEAWPQLAPETIDSPAGEVANPLPAKLPDLLMRAISLIGVKYKFGGSSAETGFDCSGFVRHVFEDAITVDLPRSSYAMWRLGAKVENHDLRPGDLVFYNTLHRAFSHVGIYLGEGRFVHAPSRGKRVEIVDMSEQYWKRRFNGARRLIDSD